jgi:hypothetical protein
MRLTIKVNAEYEYVHSKSVLKNKYMDSGNQTHAGSLFITQLQGLSSY